MIRRDRRFPTGLKRARAHDERLSSERAKKYPLLCMSNHGRWRVHAQLDDVNWFHEIVTCKVRGPDGYLYEPIWIHPTDAAKRGIKNGDVVKVFNERGAVLVRRLRHRENHARRGLRRPWRQV